MKWLNVIMRKGEHHGSVGKYFGIGTTEKFSKEDGVSFGEFSRKKGVSDGDHAVLKTIIESDLEFEYRELHSVI